MPMIATFLWLGGCYVAFSLGALRPAAISSLAVAGYLVTASGDALLAFPTDAPGLGDVVARVAAPRGRGRRDGGHPDRGGRAARRDPGPAAWRRFGPRPPCSSSPPSIGVAAGFDEGWAKVVYVVGITLPAAVVPWCLRTRRAGRDARAAALT